MIKRTIAFIAIFCLTFTMFSAQKSFAVSDDITGTALEKEMLAMIDRGIMKGFSKGEYRPSEAVTRGQFATFISRALNLPVGEHLFKDVSPTSPLATGINSAQKAGIVKGLGDGTFGVDQHVTREQAAAMVKRAFDYLEIETKSTKLTFSDQDQMSPQFKEAIAMNVNNQVIQGLRNDDGSYRFEPKNAATRAQAAAFIYRMLEKAEEVEEEELPNGKQKGFKVATIQNGQIIEGKKSYSTYAEAVRAIGNSATQVVTNSDGDIVKMPSGMAYAKPTSSSVLTTIYDHQMREVIAGLSADSRFGSEMKYIDADENKVKVEFAGQVGYVHHNNVTLVPTPLVKDRSYYSASNGLLYHHLYDHQNNRFQSYHVGKAPSFMQTSERYYSWDGAVFTSDREGKKVVGETYQYFQFLPARTKTNYTAEQLDQYIYEILQEREALYDQNPSTFSRYKDATKRSKLLNLGNYLKDTEEKRQLNALFVLSLAMHESDYGISQNALTKNNLFGIRVTDNNPKLGEKYATPEASIDSLADNYLHLNYIPPNASFANGAVPGNKRIGFNVRYASDPYWGSKVAGHMYRADQALGGEDFGVYTIGMTNTAGLNIRTSPGTSSNLLFRYKQSENPVVIVGEEQATDGATWYKIISDDLSSEEAYVHQSYVDILPIAK